MKDKEQGKNIVVVGSWNAEDHINWAKKNVARSYHLKDDEVQKVKYDYISLTYFHALKKKLNNINKIKQIMYVYTYLCVCVYTHANKQTNTYT